MIWAVQHLFMHCILHPPTSVKRHVAVFVIVKLYCSASMKNITQVWLGEPMEHAMRGVDQTDKKNPVGCPCGCEAKARATRRSGSLEILDELERSTMEKPQRISHPDHTVAKYDATTSSPTSSANSSGAKVQLKRCSKVGTYRTCARACSL